MLLQLAFDFTVEILKLGITVWMVRPFQGLAVGLQAVAQIVQHSPHQHVAGLMSPLPQLFRQLSQTLTRPTQWRLRIATSDRFHQQFQILL